MPRFCSADGARIELLPPRRSTATVLALGSYSLKRHGLVGFVEQNSLLAIKIR